MGELKQSYVNLLSTYQAAIASFGFVLILTIMLGFFASFSIVHNQLAVMIPSKYSCESLPDTDVTDADSTYSSEKITDGLLRRRSFPVLNVHEEGFYDQVEEYNYSKAIDPTGDSQYSASYDDDTDIFPKDDLDAVPAGPTKYFEAPPYIGEPNSTSCACEKQNALLKVFMYDLPQEFHFGMIEPMESNEQVWPKNLTHLASYPRGIYEQHSPEYWLTLDLLTNSEVEVFHDLRSLKRENPCGAFRVKNESEADVLFVPFFSSLSYNKYRMREANVELQKKLVRFLQRTQSWKKSEGRDHIILMHHPNSLHWARQQLKNAVFIVADFGRFPGSIANLDKDIVAPYQHLIPSLENDDFEDPFSSYEARKILLFFQGALFRKKGGVIRRRLYQILKNETKVVFKSGHADIQGVEGATIGMRSSKFCLHLAGDTPSSNRLFDAISSHCIPVIISERLELPYESIIDYTEFCIFVKYGDALKAGFIVDLLQKIGKQEWSILWKNLRSVQKHFEYHFPSQRDDAVQMIWKSVFQKLPRIRQSLHRSQRYVKSQTYLVR